MSTNYYTRLCGVSLTMLLNVEIYDLSKILTQHHYLNFGVNTKN
jgi:hypothetical protein